MRLDPIGQQVGKYQLLRLLGQGGFADVYLGEHISLKSQAAIKVLHTQLKGNDIDAFLREAQIIARLEHPHIVRILDFEVQAGIPFLVMSYLPNGTLRERHPKGTRLPLSNIVSYMKQVADALQYAHDEKVIHRDIKPENMLIGRRNEIVLSDFGIALVAQSSRYQSIQDIAGTMGYMAPEQLQGQPRPASDQYALGIVVYEWLSGERPFHGTSIEVAGQHLSATPPPLRSKLPTTSSALEEVVQTALAKDPKQRFGSIQAFARALEQVDQEGSSIAFIEQMPPQLTIQKPSRPPAQITPSIDLVSQSEQSIEPPLPYAPDQSTYATPRPNRDFGLQLSVLPSSTQSERVRTLPLKAAKRSMSTLRSKTTLFISVALLVIILGSIGIFYSRASNNPISKAQFTATSNIEATGIASSNAYASAVASNGIMFGFNAQNTRYNPYEKVLSLVNVAHLTIYWTASIGYSVSSPIVSNDTVYVACATTSGGVNQASKLYAINAKTGSIRWAKLTDSKYDEEQSPAIASGIVYFGLHDTALYAFNAESGSQKWIAPASGSAGSPTIANGVVYFGSQDGKLYAVDANTGSEIWTYSTNASTAGSSPAVANGIVYIGSADHKLYAIDTRTHIPIWIVPTGNFIGSSPTVANGIVYIGSDDHKLYAINANSGTILWTAVTDNVIRSSPAVANGIVYVGSDDSKLYAFNARTGDLLWTVTTDGRVDSSPIVANGVAYFGSADKKLYAVNAQNGAILWSYRTQGVITSSPAVVNGVVYASSFDGKLYAFHLPGTT